MQRAEWVEKLESNGKVGYFPLSEELELSSVLPITMLYNPTVCLSNLETILDLPRFLSDTFNHDSDQHPGIVYSLIVIGQGEGGIPPVETILLPGGSRKLKLTGSLGEVIKGKETCLGVGVGGEKNRGSFEHFCQWQTYKQGG